VIGTRIAHRAIENPVRASRTRELQPVASYSLQRLGRNTLIYGVGVVLSRAASFIMLPVYTRLLEPADYGVLQLLQMCVEVAAIAMAAGGTMAIYRFYYKAVDEAERRAVVTTGLVLLALSHAIACVLLAASSPWLAGSILHDASYRHLVLLTAATLALDPLTSVPMALMQIREKSALFTTVSCSRLVLQLSLNILFLVGLGWGVEGVLLSSLITTGVFSIGLTAWLLRTNGWHVRADLARPMFRFGLPYRIHSAGTFIFTFGDRFFLSASSGLAAVGIYGLAYQFGFALIGFAGNPIVQAWTPQRWELTKVRSPEERDRLHATTFRLLNLVLISTAVAMSLFAFPVLRFMSNPEYQAAARYIPVIAFAQILAFWAGLAGFGAEVSERTQYIGYATWISVGVILVLYSTLIPRYGAMGAAIATAASSVVRLAAMAWWAERLWPVAYEWGMQLRLLLLASAVGAVGALLLDGRSLGAQATISTGFFAAYLALVWVMGFVPPQVREAIGSRIGPRRGSTPSAPDADDRAEAPRETHGAPVLATLAE
jgi:O-antigen/teichoic acid export membrane protein